MKLVFYSPNFYPLIGGLENVVMDLATETSRMGYEVKVITLTPSDKPDTFPFEVIRQPGFLKTVQCIRWGSLIVQFNVSLKGIIPFLFSGRPLLITHHGEYPRTFLGYVKRWVARTMAANVGCSAYIAKDYYPPIVLPNPYNDRIFFKDDTVLRTKDIVFLGRLVSVKGGTILLEALSVLQQTYGFRPSVSIIGDGPERDGLTAMVEQLGLTSQVHFLNSRVGPELASLLNQHRIMVVPSVYDEPFGIVALEGIACGCFVIASRAGGLPEAVGSCGVTFPKGDANALANELYHALGDPAWRQSHLRHADEHLQRHTQAAVATRFLSIVNDEIVL